MRAEQGLKFLDGPSVEFRGEPGLIESWTEDQSGNASNSVDLR